LEERALTLRHVGVGARVGGSGGCGNFLVCCWSELKWAGYL
jgi:hypothetical protein